MADPRHDRGRAAERAVAAWLAGQGWRVLASRYRSTSGEIDLVALDTRRCLVAVEVRLRRSARTGEPAASVSSRHLRRVSATLASFARDSSVIHAGLRVDLVSVMPGPAPGTWRLSRLPAVDGW